MSAPFLLAYVCFSAGIIAGCYIRVPVTVLLLSATTAALALSCKRLIPALAAQLLFLALLGQQHLQQQNERHEQSPLVAFVRSNELQPFRVRGIVQQTPELSADYRVLRIRITYVADKQIDGVTRITVSGNEGEIPAHGDEIEAFARFRLPRNFGTEGSFDYERYLRKEGVHALGTIKSGQLLRILRRGSSLRSAFSRLRLRLMQRLMQRYEARDAAVLRALWLDDRAGLSPETERSLIDAGVFHVIAISGFHVAVVLAIGFLLLRLIVTYRVALIVLGTFLLFYFFLLEGRPAITRSFLLFIAFSFALLRSEKIRWGNALGLCAFLQVAWNPLDLFDAGYHLTYLSTAIIVFVAVPLSRLVRLPRAIYQYLFDFAITSFCVQILLAPYQAWTFHRVPFAALLANWSAIPSSSVLIALGAVTLPIPVLEPVLAPLIRFFLRVLMQGSYLSSGVWLFTALTPSLVGVIVFYCSVAGFLIFRGKKVRAGFVVLLMFSFLSIWIPQNRPPGGLQIHVLDVGQGDAILVRYPDGTEDLVDGGGFWNTDALDVGESVLIPYFSRMGVRRLQRVFLTHAHADHMNGLFAVLRYIPVRDVYVTRRPLASTGYQRLLREWPRDIKTVADGVVFHQAGVTLRVLAPEDSRKQLEVANDDSLVLLVEYLGRRILLTGDIEKNAEERLLAREELRGVDIIKVPHHGSKTSSNEALLQTAKAKTAVISVGHNNWFGHPAPEVVARYRRNHSMIYRTDFNGTIVIQIDTSGIHITTP